MQNKRNVEMTIQKLRFPEFRDEWRYQRLSDVAVFNNGKAHEGEINVNGRYVVVNSRFVSTGGIIKKYTNLNICPLHTGDIAMVMSDVPNGRAIASCFYIEQEDKYTLNQRICALRAKNVDSRYLFYAINRNKYYLKFDNGVSQTNLTRDEVVSLPLLMPDNKEQEKIAEFLTTVDEKISALQDKINLLKKYKKGVMQAIFSQKLRFKDENGHNFPDWKEKRLGDIGQIVGGGTPDTTVDECWNGEITWLTPTEVKEKYICQSNKTITYRGLKSSSAKILPAGTIIFTSRATIGDVGIAKVELTTNQGFQSIIVDQNNVNEFIYYWIKTNKKIFLRRASGSTFPEISNSEMKKVVICLPNKAEQQKIADFLTSLDDKIELENKKLEQAKRFKKALLQQMFV